MKYGHCKWKELLIEKYYVGEPMDINNIILMWGDTDQGAFCTVVCTKMDKETALALAEGAGEGG